jgi:GrpB-like predicted nucleotidyltransferase (UPF0157 family)
MPAEVIVVSYNAEWPQWFETIRARIAPSLVDVATGIEHVGSTSVPGLAAKPIIDVDVIVERALVSEAIRRLAALGYHHQGDLGIADREAFKHEFAIRHNLYVCTSNAAAVRNHLVLRDTLRADNALMIEYGALKQQLAARYPNDIDGYVRGKCTFIERVLSASGAFSRDELDAIRTANEQ